MSTEADHARDLIRDWIKDADLFDAAWYASQHDDVALSGLTAAAHYRQFGLRLGRPPCPDLAARLTNLPQSVMVPERKARLLAHFGLDRAEPSVAAPTGTPAPPEFDEPFYLQTNPGIDLSRTDAWGHFLTSGYREFRNPAPGFDLVWYEQVHGAEFPPGTNPFLHYLHTGKARGDATRPPTPVAFDPRWSRPLPQGARRACLFAAYDPQGRIDDYLLVLLTELARHADVYFLADCAMEPGELDRLRGVAKGAWAQRHGAYDFGSYSMLARDLVGWDRLAGYDEVLFVNDSTYLVRSLDQMFARMDATACAWWGIQATKGIFATRAAQPFPASDRLTIDAIKRQHLTAFEEDPVYDFLLGSYFLAFRRDVVADPRFQAVINAVRPEADKNAVIRRHEIGLTRFLIGCGYEFGTFVDHVTRDMPVYTEVAFDLIRDGFPLFKRLMIGFNPYRIPSARAWKPVLEQAGSQTPPAMIDAHLRRTGDGTLMHRAFGITERGRLPEKARKPAEFAAMAARVPKFPQWWAFPVGATDETLSGNARAIFDAVSEDTSLRKVILTRGKLDLPGGRNVIALRLESPEGQDHLARCGTVLLGDLADVPWPLDPARHRLILTGHGSPLLRRHADRAAAGRCAETPGQALAGSEADRLALAMLYPGLPVDAIWRSGHPQQDLIHKPETALPPDLAEQLARLRGMLGDRRLVLYCPTRRMTDPHPFAFAPADRAGLDDWLARTGTVLGLRAHPADAQTARTVMPQGPGYLNLEPDRFPQVQVLLRETAALITDWSPVLADFLGTGRPILRYTPDPRGFARREGIALHDLDQMLPGRMETGLTGLLKALDQALTADAKATTAALEPARRLLHPQTDAQNTARAVARLRATMGKPTLTGGFRKVTGPRTRRSVLFVYSTEHSAAAQWRAFNLIPALRRAGWTATCTDIATVPASAIAGAESVVLCRQPMTSRSMDVAESARALGGKVICDVDGLLFDPDATLAAAGEDSLWTRANALYLQASAHRRMLDLADAVTAATPGLERETRWLGKPTLHLPDALADRVLASSTGARPTDGAMNLIHIADEGQSLADSRSCSAAVAAFLAERPQARLHLVGPVTGEAPFADLDGQQVWRHGVLALPALAALLGDMHLALAPRTSGVMAQANPHRGVIMAAAAGVGAIVTPDARLMTGLADRDTGLIAATPADWAAALDQMARDRARCAGLGLAARGHLVAPHAPDRVAGLLTGFLQDLTDGGKG
jgi:hypothetical protein